jgi:hypothetical protein
MKHIALLLISLIFLTSCALTKAKLTPTVTITFTKSATATETQMPAATETQTPTQAATVTETEAPRFENLKPPTIEECMKNNEIHWDTLDADLGVLKAKAEAVMSPDPSVYGEYTAHIFDSVPGHMSVLQLIIPNPQIGYCAYLNHEGHEFLILGVYIKSRVGDYSEPIPFAIDLSLNRQMPDYVYKSIFDNYMSLFNNDEKNYKKLINNEAKTLEIHVAYVVGQADNDSIHKNILWLYQSEEAMFNNFLDFWNMGRYPAYMNGLNEKDKSIFTNALRVTATHLLPVSDIAVDHSVY